jgi:hypothetical protein
MKDDKSGLFGTGSPGGEPGTKKPGSAETGLCRLKSFSENKPALSEPEEAEPRALTRGRQGLREEQERAMAETVRSSENALARFQREFERRRAARHAGFDFNI